jgi:putative addiction module component (TIGR02574 family)
MSAEQILEQIEQLPLEEKQKLAEKVLERYGKFDDELTPEQAAELDRRLTEFEKDPSRGVPWEQVEADLNRRFGWR